MVETNALERGLLKDYNNKNEIRDQLSIAIRVFKECVLKFILIKKVVFVLFESRRTIHFIATSISDYWTDSPNDDAQKET